jgi:hypothetical protein
MTYGCTHSESGCYVTSLSDRHGGVHMCRLTDVDLMLCTCCALPSDGRGAPGDVATHWSRDGLHLEAQSFRQVTGARARHTLRRGLFLRARMVGSTKDLKQRNNDSLVKGWTGPVERWALD